MDKQIVKELEGTTVLVVDDDKDLADMLKEQLEVIGMKVVGVAYSGQEALDLTLTTDPALVILDIKMDDMDGIEVAQRINAIEPRPIMFLSAFSQPNYIERAKSTGVFTYLVKPITIEKIIPSIVLTMDRFREMISLKATVDDMRETIENRNAIEKAKVILVNKKNLTEEDAYSSIRRKSQEENKPMADIARAIVMMGDML
ncbi:MAG TPA: response regulator [bacterium]|nr:response regulator [bacterium]